MNNVGLVLSGGGVRGIAHLGVIKALEEHNIRVRVISGASAGAIVGAFYAAGHSWESILHFFKTTPMFSWQNYTYRKPGLLDTDKFQKVFAAYLPDDDFQGLECKLYISATDICTGQNKVFSKGKLIRKVLASAAFPIVLSPVQINGVFYADGGITNNFPVEPLKDEADFVIGSYVNPLNTIKPQELTTSMDVMERAFKIGMATLSESKFSLCDLMIAPMELTEIGTFSMNRMDEVFDIGYYAACRALAEAPAITTEAS